MKRAVALISAILLVGAFALIVFQYPWAPSLAARRIKIGGSVADLKESFPFQVTALPDAPTSQPSQKLHLRSQAIPSGFTGLLLYDGVRILDRFSIWIYAKKGVVVSVEETRGDLP